MEFLFAAVFSGGQARRLRYVSRASRLQVSSFSYTYPLSELCASARETFSPLLFPDVSTLEIFWLRIFQAGSRSFLFLFAVSQALRLRANFVAWFNQEFVCEEVVGSRAGTNFGGLCR